MKNLVKAFRIDYIMISCYQFIQPYLLNNAEQHWSGFKVGRWTVNEASLDRSPGDIFYYTALSRMPEKNIFH